MSIKAAPKTTLAQLESSNGLVLHHLNDSRSQRILWLLEELDVPYEIKKYQRLPSRFAPPELRAVHPLGKSPIITDGDVTLAESGAIVEYIITKYGKGRARPPPSGYVDNLYYTHYAEGTLAPLLFWKPLLSLILGQSPLHIQPVAQTDCNDITTEFIDERIKANFAMIEQHMQKVSGGWFAGGDEPTSADYMMIFNMEFASLRSSSVPENIKKYVERVHAMPSYQRGIEKGGEYHFASKK
ncbi:hypothetical protein FRB95_014409 [Tulasnella sp. JGI-2019a]|nr:hypothetical protein FRB95_014409 [Tulasnella sp. JGI-2019a]